MEMLMKTMESMEMMAVMTDVKLLVMLYSMSYYPEREVPGT